MSEIAIPPPIEAAMKAGAMLSVSVSGGKDSQAMARAMVATFPDRVSEIVHADLGRAEWPQTPAHVERIAREASSPLRVVQRSKGDLVQRIEERLTQVSTLTGKPPAKPFWPSAAQRYCTSDLKRDPIAKHHRSHGRGCLIVSAIGMRSEESTRRRSMPAVEIDKRITSKALRDMEPLEAVRQWNDSQRLVLKWLPIHEWPVGSVWNALGSSTAEIEQRRADYKAGHRESALSGWQGHPAYVFGNERLSCALCVLASIGDLCNGRDHNPDLYAHYVDLERQSGFTFRDGLSLADLPN